MKKAVIFDYDGVLVNTLPMCFDINKDFNPNMSWVEYQEMSNGNFYDRVREDIKENKFTPHPDFHKEYANRIREIEITDELKNLVKNLSKDFELFIVSSGLSENILEHLGRAGLVEYFQMIWGFDVHTSKVLKIKRIIEEQDIKPENIVFISDTLGDLLEGNQAGVTCIGVTWGLHEREILEKGEPVAIVDTVLELEQEVLKNLN